MSPHRYENYMATHWQCSSYKSGQSKTQTRVTLIHKAGSKFDFKIYRPISVLPSLNKVVERVLHSKISNFITNIMLFPKINKASSRINQQLMLCSNSPRSVTWHLIVKNTFFPSFSTSVRRLILFVMTFSWKSSKWVE